jgi:hypothetical protein
LPVLQINDVLPISFHPVYLAGAPDVIPRRFIGGSCSLLSFHSVFFISPFFRMVMISDGLSSSTSFC